MGSNILSILDSFIKGTRRFRIRFFFRPQMKGGKESETHTQETEGTLDDDKV
jgi:hypothetical protein